MSVARGSSLRESSSIFCNIRNFEDAMRIIFKKLRRKLKEQWLGKINDGFQWRKFYILDWIIEYNMIESYANYEWFLKSDFKDYSGKWLAIIDKKIVASGNDVKQVI